MVTKRRKAEGRLIGKRKSTAYFNYEMVNERLAKDLLSTYLKELGRIPLLTVEEEKALAEEIQEGQKDLVHRLLKLDLGIEEIGILTRNQQNISDELTAVIVGKLERLEKENKISSHKMTVLSEIRSLYGRLNQLKGEMVKRNLRLVIKIAKEHMYSGISLSDLVQEGNLGLMRAVTKFDYKRGYRFSTYATWWIRQAILRAIIEKERIIRIPLHLMEKRQKLAKTYGDFLKKQGRIPQPEEVAEKANIPLKVVHQVLFSLPATVSFGTPIGEDSSLEDFIEDQISPSPFEATERKEVKRMAEKVLSHLPPREAEILRLRFGFGEDEEHTLEEIGRRFGISRERVRQLEKKSINWLRYWKRELSGQDEKKRIRKSKSKPRCQTSMSTKCSRPPMD
jgi:RNA polymerase primary sigma factor